LLCCGKIYVQEKMQVIGQNMSLSEAEGQKFWPIYNHYVKDLQEVNNRKYALLKQYAETWATMTDQDALIYVRNWLEADGQAQALRLKYVPVVSQVLPGKEGGDVFSVGPAAEHDDRSAIVFADSVGACEGVGGRDIPRATSSSRSSPAVVGVSRIRPT
jgi:hypothetical protein